MDVQAAAFSALGSACKRKSARPPLSSGFDAGRTRHIVCYCVNLARGGPQFVDPAFDFQREDAPMNTLLEKVAALRAPNGK